MPSVQLTLSDLEELLGRSVPRDKEGLDRIFAYVKGEVESLDEQAGAVSVGVKDSNHPDIWSVEGIAHALRGFVASSQARPLRVSGTSKLRVIVDKRLLRIRPYIACAIVRGVRPSEEALKSWMNLQDKMDQTYGRDRRKASIGLYRADPVESPLHYTVSAPDGASFTPLGSSEKMSLRRILKEHPKGQEYGSIISSFREWPLLVDCDGQTLSLPPIINSNDLGRINTETRNILAEVTGTSLDTVHNSLKIIVSALAERGGRVYSCSQTYGYKPGRTITPNMGGRTAKVSLDYVNMVLGTTLSSADTVRYLRRAGYRAEPARGGDVAVEVPAHRLDIMHPVDLVEDVAIAMDLNSLKPEWPKIWTPGGLSKETEAEDTVAELMVGLGYQEVLTYCLTSPETVAGKMNAELEGSAELANPRMTTHSVLRHWLLPSLLEFLGSNTHVDYPQRIFETGPCERLGKEKGSNVETASKLAAASIHNNAGFTEIRSCLDTLLGNLGVEFAVEPQNHPSFLEGRSGAIMIGARRVGVVGEVNPRVIKGWGLSLPIAALELEMAGLNASARPSFTIR